MSQLFDSIRDGAACMVEPVWMRAEQASVTVGQSVASRRTAGIAG